jgi:esterase/lipase
MAQPAAKSGAAKTARTASTFEQAMKRVTALQALDGPEVREGSQTRLWSHGKQTDRALAFFHGYTNSPEQFAILGQQFFDLGYNVLVPRLPYHGLEDRMNKEQEKLTAQDLLNATQETVDIMQGLGKAVIITGLSAGGVMAAWAGQFRSDVAIAVPMGPAFGLPFVPAWLSSLVRNLAPHLPNFYIWWDPKAKDKIEGPVHGYPRFSTHGLAEIFRFGKTVTDAAKTTKPAAKRIYMITSGFDAAIHLPTARKVAKEWQATGGDVIAYEFPKELKIWHDMIDPAQKGERTDIVYPALINLIDKGVVPTL